MRVFKTLEHDSFGSIQANRINSTKNSLFGTNETVYNYMNITIGDNQIITPGSGEPYYDSKKKLFDLYLSNNQWVNLLLTANNNKGIPCTIKYREDLGSTNFHKTKETDENKNYNKINIVKNEFKNDLNILFPDVINKINKLRNEIENNDEFDLQHRKNIIKDVNNIINNFENNKEKIMEIIDRNIKKLNKQSGLELSNQIKSNFFNFSIAKDVEEAKEILLKSSRELGLNFLTHNNEKEVKLENDITEGVIMLKEIENQTFVTDENSKNGYSIELFEAEKTLVGEVLVINPGKKLTEVHLSVNQFSGFVTTLNSGGGTFCTLKETTKLKNIEPYIGKNIDKDSLELEFFEKTFSSKNEYLEDIKNVFEKTFKTSVLSKSKKLELLNKLDSIKHRTNGDIIFNFNSIVDNRNITITNKLTDILSSLNRGIKNLGLKTFIDDLKNNDTTFLSNLFKKHNENNNQIENKQTKVDNSNLLEM